MILNGLLDELLNKGIADHFGIRSAHIEHIKHPGWRLRVQKLESGAISIETDEGNGYGFTREDLSADDWQSYPNEAAEGRAA